MACLISCDDCAISLVLMYDASHVYSWHPCTVGPEASAICRTTNKSLRMYRASFSLIQAAELLACQRHTCRCEPGFLYRSQLARVPHQRG